ncbi:hypothetical protein FQR65_LT05448 [Abscondita terminalis]|nr:hypothetical protein FQR65_LT05448 [Abscondita terminalis]
MDTKDFRNGSKNDFRTSFKICRWSERIPARFVLYLLTLNGITMTFIMRLVIYLTILAMVKDKPAEQGYNVTETLCNVNGNTTDVTPVDYGGTLDWSLDDQFYVLTVFYWTYLVSQPFGGAISQKLGAKKAFGWSMLISSISILFIPVASYIHYIIVVLLQAVNGFAQGSTCPAVYSAIGVWIPIQERSRFVTCFQGLSLGMMLANLMSGFIIAKFGWVYVFYTAGSLGLISSLVWYLLMYDKPENHPRITKEELLYIQINREQNLHSKKNIPWLSIITSIPVLAIGITAFGRLWIHIVMQVYGPLYLKTVVGVTVEMNGLILGVSSFVAFLSSLLFSFASDKIIQHKLTSLLNNRKIFSGIGQVIPGILAVAMCFVNCNIPLIITIWILIQLFLTAGFAGNMTNIVDISPSYTGPVSSFVQVILLTPTVLSSLVAKTLLKTESTLGAWHKIFFISSGVVIGTFIIYAIFASGKVQPWDSKNLENLDNTKAKEGLLKPDKDKLHTHK